MEFTVTESSETDTLAVTGLMLIQRAVNDALEENGDNPTSTREGEVETRDGYLWRIQVSVAREKL